MPRITFTAHPINTPQVSRTGWRRSLRDGKGPGTNAGRSADPGNPPRPPIFIAAAICLIVGTAISLKVFP